MPLDRADTRLATEAQFQNEVTQGRANGQGQPRDKYYYLLEEAKDVYRSALVDVAGLKVLVVGCAEGSVTPPARNGAEVVGIDIASAPLARLASAVAAEGLSDRVSLKLMDAQQLDFPAAHFDLIACSGVLHHLDIERSARAWSRVLRHDGLVIMLEPMAMNPVAAAYRMATPNARTPDEHPLMPRDIRTLRRFFGSVDVTGFALTSPLTAPLALLPGTRDAAGRAARHLDKLDQRLLRWMPVLSYFCWTVVIRLRQPKGD